MVFPAALFPRPVITALRCASCQAEQGWAGYAGDRRVQWTFAGDREGDQGNGASISSP